MKAHNGWRALLGALLLSAAGLAQADTLQGVLPTTSGGTDYQAYYDSATNLTWLANANVNGQMSWQAAVGWANGYSVTGYDAAGQHVTVTGWRLPTTGAICYGFHCTSSEMGRLYYDALGGLAGDLLAYNHNSNYSLFSGIQFDNYWSATTYAPSPDSAWYFGFLYGSQYDSFKTIPLYAWAVHSGDVGAPPPSASEPGTLSLMLMGLMLAGIAAQRRLSHRSGR